GGRERQRLQRESRQLIHPDHREISISRESSRGETHGRGRTGKIRYQLLKRCGCALSNKRVGIHISVPRLGHVTIGGDESVRNDESSTRDARALDRLLMRKTHLINPKNVADRVAIAVEDERRHRLLLLELINLTGQTADF